jgi:hypothetical protein
MVSVAQASATLEQGAVQAFMLEQQRQQQALAVPGGGMGPGGPGGGMPFRMN